MGKASTFFTPKHQKNVLGFPDTKTLMVLLAAVEAYVFFWKVLLENPHFQALHHETFFRLNLIKQEEFTRQGICL